jgi:hypothetical protein
MARGRPRKKKEEEEVSVADVYSVLDFAKQMYNIYPNIFTPDLVNSKLKDINMNPLAATEAGINSALLNPKSNEKTLRGYSEFFEYTDMVYKRILSYLGNMLSFDYTWVCTNATEADYKSVAYKKDEKTLINFLDKFDAKQEFKKVMRQLVRQEGFFCTFRKDGEKYILQELPIDYTMVVGRWEYGLLFDFNMMWFIANPGVDLQMYPNSFKRYYKRVMDGKENGYMPSNGLDARTGEWVYWVQTSPEDGMWAWKFNEEQIGMVSFLAPMFPDLINTPLVRELQKNKYIIEATKIMIGLIPLLKDNKSGNVRDSLALQPETAGKFAGLIRQALPSAFKFGVAPFETIESFDFQGNGSNLLVEQNKVVSAISGVNSRLIFALDKQNSLETQNSISVDEYLMTYIYPYFNNFMNYYINRETKKFKFEIYFEGTEFAMNKQTRLDNANALADKGMVDHQMFAAALGIKPQNFLRRLEYTRSLGFVDKLTPIISSFQMSGKEEVGRPTAEKSGKPLSDAGQDTRDAGSNISKGGDI